MTCKRVLECKVYSQIFLVVDVRCGSGIRIEGLMFQI